MTVNHNLASLGDGPGEARAKHQGVQAHLEQLNQGLTGQPLLTPGLLEDALQLRLPDAVLSAQALLLLQADGVIGFGATTGPTVLARTVGALLEVAHGLGGERNAEGAGQAHLAAGAGGAHEFFFLSEWIACHGRAPAARGQPVFCIRCGSRVRPRPQDSRRAQRQRGNSTDRWPRTASHNPGL